MVGNSVGEDLLAVRTVDEGVRTAWPTPAFGEFGGVDRTGDEKKEDGGDD